jgi:hypothetical protein
MLVQDLPLWRTETCRSGRSGAPAPPGWAAPPALPAQYRTAKIGSTAAAILVATLWPEAPSPTAIVVVGVRALTAVEALQDFAQL